MTKKLLMGNEAIAYAALEAGVRVCAGYPGTPSSEVIETIAKLRAQGKAHGVHVEWSTNEKAALELLAGASYAGARTLFTCKQVGLNVASDPLLSLNYVGVKGGCVLLVADDPGPISSQTEQDTRRFAAFAKVPVLDPATPEQAYEMIKQAFDLSERYATPVIVRPTTRIDHASAFFEVPEQTAAREIPDEGFQKDPKWIIFPKRSYEAHAEINQRLVSMADDFSNESELARFNPWFDKGAAEPTIGIVCGGVSAQYAQEALLLLEEHARKQEMELPSYRFMQVGTPYPFPASLAYDVLGELDAVLVLEELDHVIEDELLRLAGNCGLDLEVEGKLTAAALNRGENSVEDAAERIARFFDDQLMLGTIEIPGIDTLDDAYQGTFTMMAQTLIKAPFSYDPEDGGALPVRPPVLCAGCPHRGSFYAIKRALRKNEAHYCGDIGCYTLSNAAPLHVTDTCLCMGAGITVAQGLSVVEPEKKQVAFVGDSTFFASGLTGIANAVYNGHDITIAVLDNATTAMTGSQPHPGTGLTLMGEQRKPIDIEGVLRALGVECITKANPLDLNESIAAAKEAIEFAGPSAILFEEPCIQLKKALPALKVDAAQCTGCRKCITEIGCPGIGFDVSAQGPKSKERGQAFVNPALCNGCGLCTQVCPFECIGLEAEVPVSSEVDTGKSPSTVSAAEGTTTESSELNSSAGTEATHA